MAKKRRPQRSRNQAPALLILCQGTVTEREYFEAIKQSVRAPGVTIRSEAKDPIKLVTLAKSLARNEGFDHIFIVVDEDDTPMEDLRTAAHKASSQSNKQHLLELIVSHVCFETWLVAHSRKLPAAGMDRKQLSTTLKENGLVLDKSGKHLSDTFPFAMWESASTQVTIIDPNMVGSNPATAVPHVVRRILAQGNSQ